jgi:hypothetical protein
MSEPATTVLNRPKYHQISIKTQQSLQKNRLNRLKLVKTYC